MESKRFNDALLKAVDFAFYSLGKSCRQALYFHLRIRFQVRRKEIPEKVEEFDNALRLIFKDGAFFLERLIVEKLCENLGLEFDSIQYSDFVETIARVRAMVLEGEFLSTVSCFDEEFAVAKRKKRGEGGLKLPTSKSAIPSV